MKLNTLILYMVLLSSLLALLSCREITQQMDSTEYYRKDMIITMDGVTREGIITMPAKPLNSIRVTARGDLDMFVMSDCEGEWIKEKAWNVTEEVRGGLFGWGTRTIVHKRQVDFQYQTTPPNTEGSCAVHLFGFSKEGKHSEGFFDFQSAAFELHGSMRCNKVTRNFEGVEGCQVRAGKYQEVEFFEDVFWSPEPGCEIGPTEGRKFLFKTPKGLCTYRIEGKESGKVGKLTTYGYTGILIRE